MNSEGQEANNSFKSKINIRTYTMIAALVVLWVIFTYFTNGSFLLTRNISNLARQMSIVGILGTGMVLVIVTGNIDLSVGSALGFLGGLAAVLMIWNGWGTVTTIIIILLAGLIIGLIQGVVIAYFGVPAFIVTLGGLLAFKGGLLGVTKGISIAPFSEAYRFFGQAYLPKYLGLILAAFTIVILIISAINKRRSRIKYNFDVEPLAMMALKIVIYSILIIGFVLVMNDYKGIPVPVILMGILVVIFSFIAEKTTFGRSIYAMGGNIEATKYSGINVKKNLLIVFMLNGFMAAIAGIILSARLNAGTPSAGMNMELDAIAAAVIGGTSMSGGSGKVAGAIFGALFMATIDNGMSMMNMDSYWQFIVKGLILVIAVWFDIYNRNKKSNY